METTPVPVFCGFAAAFRGAAEVAARVVLAGRDAAGAFVGVDTGGACLGVDGDDGDDSDDGVDGDGAWRLAVESEAAGCSEALGGDDGSRVAGTGAGCSWALGADDGAAAGRGKV